MPKGIRRSVSTYLYGIHYLISDDVTGVHLRAEIKYPANLGKILASAKRMLKSNINGISIISQIAQFFHFSFRRVIDPETDHFRSWGNRRLVWSRRWCATNAERDKWSSMSEAWWTEGRSLKSSGKSAIAADTPSSIVTTISGPSLACKGYSLANEVSERNDFFRTRKKC